VLPKLQKFTYCVCKDLQTIFGFVEIYPIEERIRNLCDRAKTADESEVSAIFTELRALLAEHSEFVRYLTAKTLNRANREPSSSKAAD
jgi:hypothetical protein